MALGRGLDAILLDVEEAYEKDLSAIDSLALKASGIRIEDLDVESILPNPFQPRKFFDEDALEALSISIVKYGLLQPIVVIKTEEGYLLVAGERRLRAHKLAKLEVITAIVDNTKIDEIKLRELALLENIQRENLNTMDLATAYAELIEVHNITHQALAKIVNKSRSHISNTLRLLKFIPYVQNKILLGKVTQGHVKILGGLDENQQKIMIDSIIDEKLSVREAENRVKHYKSNLKEKTPLTYEENIKKLLPFRHKIKNKSIEIHFSDAKDMQNFLLFLKKR
ncbi:Chromosome (plasmid) partitioning protein ParB [hydrothermal vent metagenome]|uniref:Chromosome (Plasmid) partitioning protein ParB n=1 Tax=hydrothermal vent metagenome TaxID=652676 RepID=A0A1W1CZ52_9ZZZZ